MKPYLLISDLHGHAWSSFAHKMEDGSNSRLMIIIAELKRAAQALKDAGGRDIIIAGDIFHVRGKIEPEVFNLIANLIQSWIDDGFRVMAIPGNHDLSSKDTTELGNAFQSFANTLGFVAITKPEFHPIASGNLFFVPWCATVDDLRAKVKELVANNESESVASGDLIIHAGIDGVMPGLPDHGLPASEVAAWGFKRVFAGHYHNHKVMEDGKVISIGATTHQTWSDIGTKAGFLIVTGDEVIYHASHAPAFVEIDETTTVDDIPLIVPGNYVRVRGLKLTDDEVKTYRAMLEGYGAKGVVFQTVRDAVSARAAPVAGKTLTLDASVDVYIDTLPATVPHDRVKVICADILTTVRSVAA